MATGASASYGEACWGACGYLPSGIVPLVPSGAAGAYDPVAEAAATQNAQWQAIVETERGNTRRWQGIALLFGALATYQWASGRCA